MGACNAYLFQFLLPDFHQRGSGWMKGPPLLESAPQACARSHEENQDSVCGAAGLGLLLLSQCSFGVGAANVSTRYSLHSRAMRMRASRSTQPERIDGELQYISIKKIIYKRKPIVLLRNPLPHSIQRTLKRIDNRNPLT